MKHAAWFVLPMILVLLSFGYLTDGWGPTNRAVAAPPLSLEGFMDEKLPEAPANPVMLNVDNSACYVCHGNMEEDKLAIKHGMEEVGCIDCHGESVDHRNDEDNITPPDKMFGPHNIVRMCEDCHDMHDAPARKVLERWQERCPGKTNPRDIVCTDCHFQHRLAFRTVWWDKQTRELIIRKEGEFTKPAVDHSRPTGE